MYSVIFSEHLLYSFLFVSNEADPFGFIVVTSELGKREQSSCKTWKMCNVKITLCLFNLTLPEDFKLLFNLIYLFEVALHSDEVRMKITVK